MQIVSIGLEILQRAGRRLGPYLMLEILLPGGTLLALLLFLYRRRQLPGVTEISGTRRSPADRPGSAFESAPSPRWLHRDGGGWPRGTSSTRRHASASDAYAHPRGEPCACGWRWSDGPQATDPST